MLQEVRPLGTERPGSQEEQARWAEVPGDGRGGLSEGTTAEFGDEECAQWEASESTPNAPVPPEGLHLLINIAVGIAFYGHRLH